MNFGSDRPKTVWDRLYRMIFRSENVDWTIFRSRKRKEDESLQEKFILVDYLPKRTETTVTREYIEMLKAHDQVIYSGVQILNGIATYEYEFNYRAGGTGGLDS